MVDYKKKIKEFELERAKYYPLIKELAEVYLEPTHERVIIRDFGKIYTTMNLIDNEYLDGTAFSVNESGSDVISIIYLGGNPLTQKGIKFLNENEPNPFRLKYWIFGICSFIAVAVIIVLFVKG